MRLSLIGALVAAPLLAACEQGAGDTRIDYGLDRKPLTELRAGIWIDPNGCDHWIIDDGLEGYLTTRLAPDGKPVCSGKPGKGYAYGPYKKGSEYSGL
jgi:hypothetical protein